MRWESMLASPCTNVRFLNALHSICTSDDLWRWSPQETSLPDSKGRRARIELPLGGSINLRILLSLFPAFERHQYS